MDKIRLFKLVCGGLIVVVATVFLSGMAGGRDMTYHLRDRGDLGPLTRADIEYLDVEAPAAMSTPWRTWPRPSAPIPRPTA